MLITFKQTPDVVFFGPRTLGLTVPSLALTKPMMFQINYKILKGYAP